MSPTDTTVQPRSSPTVLPQHRHPCPCVPPTWAVPCPTMPQAPRSCRPPAHGVPSPHPAPLTRSSTAGPQHPLPWAQAPVRYFGKDEPRGEPGWPPWGGTWASAAGGWRGGGIAPKDLPGPRPRGARCSGTAALANPTERQMAARMWDGRDGTGRAPPWPRTSRPTRWSRTPAPPGGHRACGTAGAGWWATHTPAPGWSSAGAGR